MRIAKKLPVFFFLLLLPLTVMLVVFSDEPLTPDCAVDYAVPVSEDFASLWTSQGGRISFHSESGSPFARLTFEASPDYLRFNRDAALRVRTDFACRPGERPLALDAEIRFSKALRESAELHDVMFLGTERNLYLSGAGVPRAGEWVPVRILLPSSAGEFTGIHFGAGSAWAREYEGEEIEFDLRNVVLRRMRPIYTAASTATSVNEPRWIDPERPDRADPREVLPVAPGAPVLALVDLPSHRRGRIQVEPPSGMRAEVWVAQWLPTERKIGVVQSTPMRLLPYDGERLAAAPGHPHRVWIRLIADAPASARGVLKIRWQGEELRRPVQLFPVEIAEGGTSFQIYYQVNENWTGYDKYAPFYRNVEHHFRQLRDFGFTGVHLADEPNLRVSGGEVAVNFDVLGRYWQQWPSPLARLLQAAHAVDFPDPIIWEGLRDFRRDHKWARIVDEDDREDLSDVRLVTLAQAVVPKWSERWLRPPVLSVGDEAGTQSEAEVQAVGREMRRLREAGYETYLTTHARLYDTFHRLAPELSINVLHAEDVTAGSRHVVARHAGRFWIYNGGSMNISAPISDRFFAGAYSWRAGADGVTQWVHTRPSQQADPLDLRTFLSDDAQFYVLPGRGDQGALTPGFMGFSAGIVDRHILDLATRKAREGDRELQRILQNLHDSMPLPHAPSEYTLHRLRRQSEPHEVRWSLLTELARLGEQGVIGGEKGGVE